MKLYTRLALLLIAVLWLTACTGLGFNFSEKRTAIITRGGYQIAVTGDLTPEATDNILRVVDGIGKYPYVDAHFNEMLNVNLDSSDTETSTTSNSNNADVSRHRTRDIYDVQP